MIKNGKITILENIVVDKKLPKYKKEENKKEHLNEFDGDSGNLDSPNFIDDTIRDTNFEYLVYIQKNAPTLFNKFKLWLYKKLYSNNFGIIQDKKTILTDVKEFFDLVKSNVNELDKKEINDILEKYHLTLKNAEYNNQTALVERIVKYASVLKFELALSTSEFNQYLTEEDIVKFHSKASVHEKFKTGLCLTYVKNFIKIIPFEITELKKKADELKVFDNYVILHYDPSGEAVKDTKAEIKKKKDPVLFGVIKGSTNLHYIGDWIDDYCDLTLDVIIKKIKKQPEIIDTNTVKENIEKI